MKSGEELRSIARYWPIRVNSIAINEGQPLPAWEPFAKRIAKGTGTRHIHMETHLVLVSFILPHPVSLNRVSLQPKRFSAETSGTRRLRRVGTVRMNEQRFRLAFHHIGADDHLLDRFKAR